MLCRAAAVKYLIIYHYSAGYISFILGSLTSSWLFLKSNIPHVGVSGGRGGGLGLGGRMQPRKLQCCI